MESGSPDGGALPLTDIPSVAAYFTLLGRKKTATPTGERFFLRPATAQPMRNYHNSPLSPP